MAVHVFTDSTSCLPEADRVGLGVTVVPVYLRIGEAIVAETDVDPGAFLETLTGTGDLPTSSQPSPEDFARVFREAALMGHDVIAVLVSAKMSGTFSAAALAADLVRAELPGARIVLVDSQSNSMQEGFAVLAAARAAAKGGSLAECRAAAQASVARSRFLFTPESLDFLARGGRIFGAARLLGGLLRIAPILTAEDGKSGVAGIERTRKRALERIARTMREDVERFGLQNAVVQVIGASSEAGRFARDVIGPIAGFPVSVVPVGAVVALHVGPALGVAYETLEPMR